MMGSIRPAAWLLFGGVLAAMCGRMISAMEIILPLYQFPTSFEAPMWKALKEVAEAGHEITGILNPNSGPNVDSGGLTAYLNILNNFLERGRSDENGNPIPDGFPALTIICYVSTDFGDQETRPELESVYANIDTYLSVFPRVCDGIFFDEAPADISFKPELGDLYKRYNSYAAGKGLSVTFNPGSAADPAYFTPSDVDPDFAPPTLMSYENFYAVMKNVGVPKPVDGGTQASQQAMLVHTAAEIADNSDLISNIVHKAGCAGWGQIYLTSETFAGNPWDQLTSFWDDLVDAVYGGSSGDCSVQQEPTLMVPLYLDSSPDVTAVTDVVLKTDYLEMKSVWVIVDADDSIATTLSDSGAKVLCYFDFDLYASVYPLIEDLAPWNNDDTMKKVCGGFFVDNYREIEDYAEPNFSDLYFTIQGKIPRGALVVKYKVFDPEKPLEFNPYGKDFSEISLGDGPVVVVTEADISSRPFELPTPQQIDHDGDVTYFVDVPPEKSALLVTGFTETDPEAVQCLLNEIGEVFTNYVYIMGDTATTYLAELHDGIETPTAPDCNAPEELTCSSRAESCPTGTIEVNRQDPCIGNVCDEAECCYGCPIDGDQVEVVPANIGIRAGEYCSALGTNFQIPIDDVLPLGIPDEYEVEFAFEQQDSGAVAGVVTGSYIEANLIPNIEAALVVVMVSVTAPDEPPASALLCGGTFTPVCNCRPEDPAICGAENSGYICCEDKHICDEYDRENPGACGDPHMTGFLGQKFDFTGEDGAWYSLIADDKMHINMRVTSPVADLPEITYITGLSVLTTDVDGFDHSIVIDVKDPHNLDSSCPADVPLCLADGSLRVTLDDEEALVAPGTVSLGQDVLVSAVNLPGACRSFGFETYWERKKLENVRDGRRLGESINMGEWILGDPTATNMEECTEYVVHAVEAVDDGLFAHESEHALFQIVTPKATIRLSHGRLHQIAMRDPTDQFDLPDHLTWQMNMAVDHNEVGHDAKGVLGETLVPTRDADGKPIMTGMEAIRGMQEDYRVEGALGMDFLEDGHTS